MIESLQQLDKTLQRDVDDMYITEKIYRNVDTAVNFGGKIVFFLKRLTSNKNWSLDSLKK